MAEEFIDIDLDTVDDGTDPMPTGLMECEIKIARHKHKEGSDYPYIGLDLRPIDDRYKNRTAWLNLSYHPKAMWNMKLFVKAFRIPQAAGGKKGFVVEANADGEKVYPDFVGKRGFVTLGIEPSQNDPERKVNTVSNPYHPSK